MSVRADKIQITIDFITDESKALAKAITDVDTLRQSIVTNQKAIKDYDVELKKTNLTEVQRAEILLKKEQAEKAVKKAMDDIVRSGKQIESLDLTKVAPAQLTQRANQLAQAMRNIPASAPEFKELEAELARVNAQLGTLRANAKGIQDVAPPEGGGFLQRVLGVAGGFALFDLAKNALRSLFTFGRDALREVDAGLKADAQVKQAIQSTAGAAGRSFEQLKQQAEDLQKVTLIGDEQTEGAQALLLTFKNIKTEIFDETVPLVQDLSTAFSQDLKASAIQVGKALEDPVRGVTALRRVGVTFSEDQQRMIKSLVDTGRTADAQRIILKELESQVGGSARAAAEAGLGPYQLLQNRLGEVKESVGALIERGLRFLLPAFKEVTVFLEGLTDSLLSGEKATGKYAGAVNFTVSVLSGLVKAGQFLYEIWKLQIDFIWKPLAGIFTDDIVPALVSVGNGIDNLIERAKSLPVIGFVFRQIAAFVGFFKDAINDVPSAFAGMQAGAKQAVENVKEFFVGLVRSAKIVALELAKALTLDAGARATLTAQITSLKNEEIAAKQAGKTVGQAYVEARDAALKDSRAASAAEAQAQAKAEAIQRRQAEAQEAEQDAKAYEERRKKQFELALKGVEADTKRRELVLENARIKDQISEERYNEGLTAIRERELKAQLDVYKRFRKDQENEALALRNRLAEIEQGRLDKAAAPVATLPGRGPGQVTSTAKKADNTGALLDAQDVGEEALQEALRKKFEAALISEQEYNIKKLQLQLLNVDEELNILRNSTQPQVDEIRKREEQKKQIQIKIGKETLDSTIRLEQLKQQALLEGTKALGDVFSVAADLLSQDEKSKKKHAGVVKALQVAQIQVNLASEISGIFANAQQSAIAKLLGPVAGTILAFVQAAVATVRAGIAVGKVQAAKFERGKLLDFAKAKMGFFGGKPHSQGGTKGYFEDGTAIEVEKDEAFAVVNKHNAPLLRLLSNINSLGGKGVQFFAKGGLPRFDTGGLPNINTTPTSTTLNVNNSPQDGGATQRMEQAASLMLAAARAFPTRVKADVVLTELETAQVELDTVRNDAAL